MTVKGAAGAIAGAPIAGDEPGSPAATVSIQQAREIVNQTASKSSDTASLYQSGIAEDGGMGRGNEQAGNGTPGRSDRADDRQEAQRGQRALEAAPLADLTGNEIAPAETPLTDLRAAARSWYRDNLAGTSVDSAALGRPVLFGTSSRKAFSASADPRKLKLFAALPKLIAGARLIDSLPPRDPSAEPSTRAYHYLEAVVNLEGAALVVGVTIRENTNGDFFYNHVINEKGLAAAPEDTARKAGPGDNGEAALDSIQIADAEINPSTNRSLDQSARGRIDFGPTGSIIRLFQGRDLSTVLHEGWHQWLEEMRFDATSPGASESLRQRWQVLTDWFAANGHPLNPDGTIPNARSSGSAGGGGAVGGRNVGLLRAFGIGRQVAPAIIALDRGRLGLIDVAAGAQQEDREGEQRFHRPQCGQRRDVGKRADGRLRGMAACLT